jgi:hypothetical protein
MTSSYVHVISTFNTVSMHLFVQEFGIDIVGDDNKTIIHHKVAARVVCVFSEQDVQFAARAEAHQQQQAAQQQASSALGQSSLSPGGPSNIPPVFGFSGAGRRPPMQSQLGGMGGGMRPPGSSKTGLTFDHILSRLQGELQKSRDTSAELSNLTSTINEIGDVLGGTLVSFTGSVLFDLPTNNLPLHLPAAEPSGLSPDSASRPTRSTSATSS